MKFRFAKSCDVNQIATLHYNVRDSKSIGFFTQMRKPFLRQYYKIIISDPNEIILCAVDDNNKICGFASASLNVEEQFKNLRKHKLVLGLASISSFMLQPNLILKIWKRYQSTGINSKKKFVTATGARGEYWMWDPNNNESIWSTFLNNKHLEIIYILGIKNLSFEVDAINDKVVSFSKMNGADEINRIILDDGRERILMDYDLKKKFTKKQKLKEF